MKDKQKKMKILSTCIKLSKGSKQMDICFYQLNITMRTDNEKIGFLI